MVVFHVEDSQERIVLVLLVFPLQLLQFRLELDVLPGERPAGPRHSEGPGQPLEEDHGDPGWPESDTQAFLETLGYGGAGKL